jgi:hypothetical protein
MNGPDLVVSPAEVDESCERDNDQINYHATGILAVPAQFLSFSNFRFWAQRVLKNSDK